MSIVLYQLFLVIFFFVKKSRIFLTPNYLHTNKHLYFSQLDIQCYSSLSKNIKCIIFSNHYLDKVIFHHLSPFRSLFLKKDFIYLFYFQREGKKHQCVVASGMPPTGGLACNPGMCPDWESNQQPFGLQAGAHSTEPHQLGPINSS